MDKPKALVFYTYLPPWRIDVFNAMGKFYDLTVIFLYPNAEGFTYDRVILSAKLKVDYLFLENGFTIGSRPFRTGIYKLIKKFQPAVVFSHEYSPTSILLAFSKMFRLFNFRLIITTSDNLQISDSVAGLRRVARRLVLSQAKGVVVYSEPVKKWYQQHFPGLKIEICPNIQNETSLLSHNSEFPSIIEQYQLKFRLTNMPIILYVGRLNHGKGLELLLNSWVNCAIKSYKLVLVGDGPLLKELKKLTNTLGIADKVVFAGFYSGAGLYAWYAMANFLIFPSTYERFGAVVNEALVYGCPVMASKYIGAIDFIDERHNGLIFDPLKPDEFTAKLDEAFIRFNDPSVERRSLMTHTFDQYITSFKSVVE